MLKKLFVSLIIFSLIFLIFPDLNKISDLISNPAPSPLPQTGKILDDSNNIHSSSESQIEQTLSNEVLEEELYIEYQTASLNVPDSLKPENAGLSWQTELPPGGLSEFFKEGISFSDSSKYFSLEGIGSFRGTNYRDTSSYGFTEVKEQILEVAWSLKNSHIDIWTGTGWNGQPSIIRWNDSLKNKMNILNEKKKKNDLKEIIYATLDGNIYFLDLDDGSITRPPIETGFPHKGSVVIDPRGYPLLYAGQGINTNGKTRSDFKYRIFSLLDQKLLYSFSGNDKFALRNWGAFDSGALIDKRNDVFIECGENGILYLMKLNSIFDLEKGIISINPVTAKYRYKYKSNTKPGTENSPVAYKNLIYFADNSGVLQCVDLNTLKPLWVRKVPDDTDSSIVLEDKGDGNPFLYTACEVDQQGKGGKSHIIKIQALTGELLWEVDIDCYYDSQTNGGVLATPVLGKHEISDLIIYNIAKSGKKSSEGLLIALRRSDGKEVWRYELSAYSWSSPVDIYTSEGKAYLLVCDSAGFMHLFEGKTGKLLYSLNLGANIEATPAVFENMAVVGTRGQKIYGIRIK